MQLRLIITDTIASKRVILKLGPFYALRKMLFGSHLLRQTCSLSLYFKNINTAGVNFHYKLVFF